MKKIICVFVIICILTLPTFAYSGENEIITENSPEQEIEDMLPEDVQEFLGEQEFSFESMTQMSFVDILNMLLKEVEKVLLKPLEMFLKLCGILIIAGLLNQFKTSNDAGIRNALDIAVTISVFILVSVPCLELLGRVEDSLNMAKNAMISFVPVFSSVMVTCGQPASAVIYSGLFLSTTTFVAILLLKYIVPFIRIYMALTITQGISSSLQLSGITTLISKSIKWTIGFLSTLFVGLLGFQTFVAHGADTMALKMGKFLIGSGVPVIGRAVSDAMGTVFTSLKLVKGMVGTFGVVGLIGVFLPILLSCIVYFLILTASKSVAEVLDNKRAARILHGFGECITLYITIILFFALLLIFATVIMMITGNGGA